MHKPPTFPVGKLPPEYLERLLAQSPAADPRLLVGAGVGEDAAVIEMPDRYLVAKTDPITFATEKIGWYAVHVNANDVVMTGARPLWFLATLLLPEGAAPPLVEEIFTDIGSACRELGVILCGGHTEVTHDLHRPVVVGQMLGEVSKERLLRKESLAPGDVILLTRGVAIEGTALIAREKYRELADAIPKDILDRARNFLFDPGISVVPAALIAAANGAKAMHDPTEGGILAGLLEMAVAARRGIVVHGDEIAVLPETRAICAALKLDPLALLASGALLVGSTARRAQGIRDALGAAEIPSAVVAEIVPFARGRRLEQHGNQRPLQFPERDELARLF